MSDHGRFAVSHALGAHFRRFLAALVAMVVPAAGLVALAAPAQAVGGDSFISVWDTRNTSTGSTDNKSIKLPLPATTNLEAYNFIVDYGDGTAPKTVTSASDPDATHLYETAGVYTVTIDGVINGWRFRNTGDRLKLLEIQQWGVLQFGNAGNYFQGAANFNATATDAPDLSGTTNMQAAFSGASSFNGNLSNWDVSNVTYMQSMFQNATSFTGASISNWDTSSAEAMTSMFRGATAFNGDVSGWSVSSVYDMQTMFSGATSFNRNLGRWNVSNVETMAGMFNGVELSRQNYDALLTGWASRSEQIGVEFSAGNSWYTAGAPATARAKLINDYQWVITDAGMKDVPGKPTNVDGTVRPERATITWTAPPDNNAPITRYRVTSSPESKACETTASGGNPPATSCTVTGLTNDTEYTFTVVATNEVGDSAPSDPSPGLIPREEPPGTPLAPKVTSRDTAILVTPKAATEGGTPKSYTATAKSVNDGVIGDGNTCTFNVASASRCAITGLVNGEAYTVTLTATNNGGTSASSEPSEEVTPEPAFITTWDTRKTHYDNGDTTFIRLPLVSDGTYDFTVDYGDGTDPVKVTSSGDSDARHTYASPGVYEVAIRGTIRGWSFGSDCNRDTYAWKLTDVNAWGGVRLDTPNRSSRYFSCTSNLVTISASDNPDLSQTTSLRGMFASSGINSALEQWDTSNITDMSEMFSSARSFNQPLGEWDTSKVTDMSSMFQEADAFDQSLNDWDTSNVTEMDFMFSGADAFNSDISGLDTSNVTTMESLFYQTWKFNQPIGSWNTSKVTNFANVFNSARDFDQEVNDWDVSQATNIRAAFANKDWNHPLDKWDVSNVVNAEWLFSDNKTFNQNINGWNVSAMTNMTGIFRGTLAYDQPLDQWGDDIAAGADNKRVTLGYMFYNADGFNQDITGWDTSKVYSMFWMFRDNDAFNQPIGSWDVSKVVQMQRIFDNSTAFDQPLNDWDVSGVNDFSYAFANTDYNRDLSGWEPRSASNFEGMFANNTAFNQDISGWNMSAATSLGKMFSGATAFNQPLNSWNTSSVTDMDSMFSGATAFNQPLDRWRVNKVRYENDERQGMRAMFTGSALSLNNYNKILVGWAKQAVYGGVRLNSPARYSTGAPADARASLVARGWNISDAGETNANVPDAPVDVVWTFDGTTATITWPEPAANNSPITKYTVTAYDITGARPVATDKTCVLNAPFGETLSCEIADVTPGDYAFGVVATNGVGDGDSSIFEEPAKPAAPFVTPQNDSARVGIYSPPNTGGEPTSYVFTADSGQSCAVDAPATSCVITGLTNGDERTFTAKAANWMGESVASEPSAPVTITDAFVTDWETFRSGEPSRQSNVTLPLANHASSQYDFTVYWGDGTKDRITAYNDAAVTHEYAAIDAYEITITGTVKGWRMAGSSDPGKWVSVKRWGPLRMGNATGYFQNAVNLENNATDDLVLGDTTNLDNAFRNAAKFDVDLSGWDTSSVTRLNNTFQDACALNPDVAGWDTSNVTTMNSTFAGCGSTELTSDLSGWNTSNVTDMSNMFYGRKFNGDITDWDVKKVTNFGAMFYASRIFNQPIGDWLAGPNAAVSLERMFNYADAFNQPIGSWDISKVTNLSSMFRSSPFNQDISDWNTSKVTNFDFLFAETAFNQDISDWNVTSATTMKGFTYNSPAMANTRYISWYNDILLGWSGQNVKSGVRFDMCGPNSWNWWEDGPCWGGIKYSIGAPAAARSALVNKGWRISDGGQIDANVPNRPYNVTVERSPADGDSAVVSWQRPNNNKRTIEEYVVTAVNGGQTCTVGKPAGWPTTQTPTTCTVTGLGSEFTKFTVVAWNEIGASLPSIPAPYDRPSAPEKPVAVAGDGSATVTVQDSGRGGPPQQYTVTSTPGDLTCTVEDAENTDPDACTVEGLTNGVSYTFTAVATNTGGDSPVSAVSDAVIPLAPARAVEFDTPVPTKTGDGFTAQISNFDAAWLYEGTATADGTVTVSDSGLVTVTGVAYDTEVTATVSSTRFGYFDGTGEATARTLLEPITPNITDVTPTIDGFTASLSNISADYVWTGQVDIGTLAFNTETGDIAVTGTDPLAVITLSVNGTRDGYADAFAEIEVTALGEALDPTFANITRTATGFTAEISNFDSNYTYAGTATADGTVAVNEQGFVTVTGVAPNTESTATIISRRDGYLDGSAEVTETSLDNPLTPAFGDVLRTRDGFTFVISNYDAAFTWLAEVAVTSGEDNAVVELDGAAGTVTGLAPAQEATVTVTSSQEGYVEGTGTLTESALEGARIPVIGDATPTADGFTAPIENYDGQWTWTVTATAGGSGSVDDTGLLTVTGVDPDTEVTATVTASRSEFDDGSAEKTATSLKAALVPTFGDVARTEDGFSAPITNYDVDYSWNATLESQEGPCPSPSPTDGTASPTPTESGPCYQGQVQITVAGSVLVTGLDPDTQATVTVTAERGGYATGSAAQSGTSLLAKNTPAFGPVTRTADGFEVALTNFDDNFTYELSATNGAPVISGTGTITVTGLDPDASAIVTVNTSQLDHADGTADIEGTALGARLDPVLGEAVPAADGTGFSVPITNYDSNFTWNVSVAPDTASAVVDAGNEEVVVSGLAYDTPATVTVTTTKDGYADGQAEATGTTLKAPLTPTFGTPSGTPDGFTAVISNYDSDFTYAASTTSGSVEISNGSVVVTGLAADSPASVSVEVSRTGYVTSDATVEASSLKAALTPTFGTPTRTAGGFTVQVTNYDAAYTWTGTATASGSVAVSDSGLVTVSGVSPNTSSTATIRAARDGYTTGSAPVTATSLGAARTPVFGTVTARADGFTVQVSNYSASWTWTASSTTGTAAVSGTGLVTVSGLNAGESATVTVDTQRTGFVDGSAQQAGAALIPGVTPTFDPAVPTADGFTAGITNFDPAATYLANSTAGEAVVTDAGVLEVTGVEPETAVEATVTVKRSGYTDASASVTETSLMAGYTAEFGTATPDAAGFTVPVTNYDDAYNWAVTSDAGSASIDAVGLITVSGLGVGEQAKVSVTTSRAGYADKTVDFTGSSLQGAGLVPTFGTPVPTADGFTVEIDNYDSDYTFSGTANEGGSVNVTVDAGVATAEVTGVSPDTNVTATIKASRRGYQDGTAQVSATSLKAALVPTYDTPTPTSDGFTVQVTNYGDDYEWSVSADSGTATIDATGLILVTGASADTLVKVETTATRSGYADGTSEVSATSLKDARTPTFGLVTPTADGFTVEVSNYDSDWTWTANSTAGSAAVDGNGLVTVSGLDPDATATVTVGSARVGYTEGSAEQEGTSLKEAWVPTFGTVTPTADGFTAPITNYDAEYTWEGTATAGGEVSISDVGEITVTGVDPDTSVSATITASREGYASGEDTITGTSLKAKLTPGFGPVTRTADGFTVRVSNYDGLYEWAVEPSEGGAVIDDTGLITVTGLDPDTNSTVTVIASREGFATGTADVSGTSLQAALVPTFGTVSATADGYRVQITNYDANYTWSGTATNGGTVAISNSGRLTVSDLPAGTDSTVTVTTTRTAHADGSGEVSGTAQAGTLTPLFGDKTRTPDGFTVQVVNYDDDFTWGATSSDGAAVISDTGLVTVTGLQANTAATVTVTTSRTGYGDGSAEIQGTSLQAARTPQLSAPRSTADGFTVTIENYSADWSWNGSATGGATVTVSNSGLVTVKGLAAEGTSDLTVTSTRSGYADGSSSVSGGAWKAALTPTFDTPAPTADGFTVNITNYSADFTWGGSATNGGQVEISDAGLVTVTGLVPDVASVATITTAQAGFADGTATVSGRSLKAKLVPAIGGVTRTDDGFTALVDNYDPAFTWGATTSDGSAAIDGSGLVTVSGLDPDTLATVTVTTSRTGYAGGSADKSGTSLKAPLTLEFGEVTPTDSGFRFDVTTYSGDWTWSAEATNSGTAAVSRTGRVTVTDLSPGATSTVTVTARRTGFAVSNGDVTGTSNMGTLTPEFGDKLRTADGFTVDITNYSGDYEWLAATTAGEAAVGTDGVLTVSGLQANTAATVTVTTSRTGYGSGSAQVSGTSLREKLTPVLGAVTRTADGFTFKITNYSLDYAWSAVTDEGEADTVGDKVVVTGLEPGQEATVTVGNSRPGYDFGSATQTGNALDTGRTPTFGPVSRTSDGFTVVITNHSLDYTWAATSDRGSATITGDTLVVSGLRPDTEAKATVTTTRIGYTDGEESVTGTSKKAGLAPMFGAVTRTEGGFTVPITNHNGDYTYDPVPTAGAAVVSNAGVLEVTGLDDGQQADVAVTVTRSDYDTASGSVTGSALAAARTPQVGSVQATADGFTVQITNYDAQWTWSGQPSPSGTVTVSDSGLVTLSGVEPATEVTVAISSKRSGYLEGTKDVTGTSLDEALTPEFENQERLETSFSVEVANFDDEFTWDVTSTAGSASIDEFGVVRVTGLVAGTKATVTATTTRAGYAEGTGSFRGETLNPALTPTLSEPVSSADGFTTTITNYSALYTWTGTATAGGDVEVNGDTITVMNLQPGTTSVLTVTAARGGYLKGTATVSGRSQTGAALTPAFATPTPINGGFTVQIRNYNRAFQWSATATAGTAKVSGSGLVTVSGLAPAATARVTVTAKRAGYLDGSASVSGSAAKPTPTPTPTPKAPGKPTIDKITVKKGVAKVFWKVGNNGGARITKANAVCTHKKVKKTGSGNDSPVTVKKLKNRTTYTCKVTVTNSAGTSPASDGKKVKG